jgi:hypothetical protein
VKLGAESRNKVIAATALIVVAVVLMATRFSGFISTGPSSAPEPAPSLSTLSMREHPPRGGASLQRGKKNTAPSLDPTLHTELLQVSEGTKYEGTGRNIFKVFVEIPKPIIPPVVAQTQNQGPPLPPPPPPINMTFYGFATPAGGQKRIFLAQGEDVFIAKEGDIVDRRYKVVRISANAVEILDVLSNNRQSIPLTQG